MGERPLPSHVLAAIERGQRATRVVGGSRAPRPEQDAQADAGAGASSVSTSSPKPRRGVMNKTEARYAAELEARALAGELSWWAFERVRLRLANGAWYCPDFVVSTAAGEIEMHEVKGSHIREAAMVRLKVAASLYPFRFVLVQFTKAGQTSKEIKP